MSWKTKSKKGKAVRSKRTGKPIHYLKMPSRKNLSKKLGKLVPIEKYKIKYYSNRIMKDYGGMNHWAALQLGFKPLLKENEIFILKGHPEDVEHEIREAEKMRKRGLKYWKAHSEAITDEKKKVKISDVPKGYFRFITWGLRDKAREHAKYLREKMRITDDGKRVRMWDVKVQKEKDEGKDVYRIYLKQRSEKKDTIRYGIRIRGSSDKDGYDIKSEPRSKYEERWKGGQMKEIRKRMGRTKKLKTIDKILGAKEKTLKELSKPERERLARRLAIEYDSRIGDPDKDSVRRKIIIQYGIKFWGKVRSRLKSVKRLSYLIVDEGKATKEYAKMAENVSGRDKQTLKGMSKDEAGHKKALERMKRAK